METLTTLDMTVMCLLPQNNPLYNRKTCNHLLGIPRVIYLTKSVIFIILHFPLFMETILNVKIIKGNITNQYDMHTRRKCYEVAYNSTT